MPLHMAARTGCGDAEIWVWEARRPLCRPARLPRCTGCWPGSQIMQWAPLGPAARPCGVCGAALSDCTKTLDLHAISGITRPQGAMPPPIVDVHHRLEALVVRACAKQQTGASLDPSLLSDIKALCRQSDDNVQMAWEAAWGQLRAPHAQVRRCRRPPACPVPASFSCLTSQSPAHTAPLDLQSRLLALLLCEQLFQRSHAFRRALLGRLSQVRPATGLPVAWSA